MGRHGARQVGRRSSFGSIADTLEARQCCHCQNGRYRKGLVMTTIEEKLPAYGVDVDFPEVNGLEHLQMLLARGELHSSGHLLENEQ